MNNYDNKEVLDAIAKLSNQIEKIKFALTTTDEKIEISSARTDGKIETALAKASAKTDEKIKEAINNFSNKMDKKFSEIRDELSQKIDKFKEEVNERFNKLEDEVEILQEDTNELKIETRNISRSVAVIEQEHGEKLSILFDAITVSNERQDDFDKRLAKFERKIENNENQIYLLNSKVQKI